MLSAIAASSMDYSTSISDAEAIGFLKQDSATQTTETELLQLKDMLATFERLRAFAEKLNGGAWLSHVAGVMGADLPNIELIVTAGYETRLREAVACVLAGVAVTVRRWMCCTSA